MPNDPNVSTTGGDILGADDTANAKRKHNGWIPFSCMQTYRHKIAYHNSNQARFGIADSEWQDWRVLPVGNALPKAVMPREWVALSQMAREIRIDSIHVRCWGWSLFAISASQNETQVQSVPNIYLYNVTDNDYLLPGYNINECHYDVGSQDFSQPEELKAFIMHCEPWIVQYQATNTGDAKHYSWDQQSMNMFRHPDFQMIKQVDEFNYSWHNSENVSFHPAMPFATNLEPYAANSYWSGFN